MRNDNLTVDWLELSNSGLIGIVKTSPVIRSTELTETEELSKTPVFLYFCMCVCYFGVFSSFRTEKK